MSLSTPSTLITVRIVSQSSLNRSHLINLYLVQHVHSPQRATSEEEAQKARTTIIAAFDFVMNAVGSDIKAGDLWMRYLRFVKAGEVYISIVLYRLHS